MEFDIDEIPLCLINITERVDRLERTMAAISAFYGFNKEVIIINGRIGKRSSEEIAKAHSECKAQTIQLFVRTPQNRYSKH